MVSGENKFEPLVGRPLEVAVFSDDAPLFETEIKDDRLRLIFT
jgi:hypothetical protein